MAQGVLEGHPSSDGALILSINGSLDTTSTGQAWRRALQLITEHQPKGLIVDASHLTYCDGAGAALGFPAGVESTPLASICAASTPLFSATR